MDKKTDYDCFTVKPLVIIKAGNSYPGLIEQFGDFEHWIIDRLGALLPPVTVVDPRSGQDLPELTELSGAIITGSHCMVTDQEPWSEKLAAWLHTAVLANLPILGICYGHQLLAHALGGEVGYHPDGLEIGTVAIQLTSAGKADALFYGMPDEFMAQVVHRQSILKLPQDAVLLAGNAFEPNHAFRIGSSAWGVQFHPEFSPEVMSGYIGELKKLPKSLGQAYDSILAEVSSTDEADLILKRFTAFVSLRAGG